MGLTTTSATAACVDTHIRRLRTKIEDDPERPRVIITARGSATGSSRPGIEHERFRLAG